MIDALLKNSLDKRSTSLKELFTEKLQTSGLTKTQYEEMSGIARRSLDGILNSTSKQTDVVNLLKLGDFIGIELDELVSIYFSSRPKEEIRSLNQARMLTFLNENFDIKQLEKMGFLKRGMSPEESFSRISTYFGFTNLSDFDTKLDDVLYSRSKKPFNEKMKDFWIKASYKYFELLDNPNGYDRDSLVRLIPSIRPYTMNVKDGLTIVCRALFNIGITVVYQQLVPTTHIRGATFIVNDKPCIVLTDYMKSYPTIWFALIHELHHVLYDLEELQRVRYHLSGDPDLFLIQEEKANNFASEYLFSKEKMNFIEPMIHSPTIVNRFAEKCQIHPSIIYSQYQFRQKEKGNNYWGAFKKFFPDIKEAISPLNASLWEVESLDEASLQLKKVLNSI